jgi:hypothetical protein
LNKPRAVEDVTAFFATSAWAFRSADDLAVRIAQTLRAYLRRPITAVRNANPARIRAAMVGDRNSGSVLMMFRAVSNK